MKLIPLTKGLFAQVDGEDYEKVNKFKWCANKGGNTFYGRTGIGKNYKKLHRFILGITDPKIFIDHEDLNGLNCQKYNLRIATRSQNGANRILSNKKYKGVYFKKSRNKWYAQCRKDGHNYEKCSLNSEVEAAIAYNDLAIKLHGRFAKLNIIPN